MSAVEIKATDLRKGMTVWHKFLGTVKLDVAKPMEGGCIYIEYHDACRGPRK